MAKSAKRSKAKTTTTARKAAKTGVKRSAKKSAKKKIQKAGKKAKAAKATKAKKSKKAAAKNAGRIRTLARPAGANLTAAGFRPPHKCRETIDGCLKFYPDKDGNYTLPRGGESVDPASCDYWF